MIGGIITARHILMHPATLIAAVGLVAYAVMVLKIFDAREYRFVELMYAAQKGPRSPSLMVEKGGL